MANEITASLSLQATKNGLTVTYPTKQFKADQTGFGSDELLVTTGAAAQLALTVTPGLSVFENKDGTDDIIVGPEDPNNVAAMVDFVKIRPGKAVLLDIDDTVDVWAKASNNTPQLLVFSLDQ